MRRMSLGREEGRGQSPGLPTFLSWIPREEEEEAQRLRRGSQRGRRRTREMSRRCPEKKFEAKCKNGEREGAGQEQVVF